MKHRAYALATSDTTGAILIFLLLVMPAIIMGLNQ